MRACLRWTLSAATDILKALENVGCSAIVNFPSVTAIDGEMRTSLEEFGYGVKTELLLRRAVAQGGSALALVDSVATAQEALAIGVRGLVAPRYTNEGVLGALSELDTERHWGCSDFLMPLPA